MLQVAHLGDISSKYRACPATSPEGQAATASSLVRLGWVEILCFARWLLLGWAMACCCAAACRFCRQLQAQRCACSGAAIGVCMLCTPGNCPAHTW